MFTLIWASLVTLYQDEPTKAKPRPSNLFKDTEVEGSIHLARINPIPPADVQQVIKRGTVSIQDLRQLALSGNPKQKFWAIFCIGKMSRQKHDLVFLTQLTSEEDWLAELKKSPLRPFTLQILQDSIKRLDASTEDEKE